MGLFQKMSLYEAFALLCSRKSSKKDLEKATKIICALPPDDRRSAPYIFLCMVRSQHVGVAYEALRHEEDKGELSELMLSVLDLPVVFDEFQAAYQSGTDSPLAAIYVARAYESGWGIEKNHEKAVEVVRAWGDVPGAYANEAEKIRKVILSADKPKAPAPSAAPKTVDTIFGKVNVADKPTQTTPVNKSAKATNSTACDDTKNRSAMSADEAFDIAQTLWEQKKYEEANRYYEIAAQQGHAKAMNCLGCLYRYGEGVKKDIEKALDYFEAALTAGNPKGGANIGMVYYNGEEGEPDFDKAFPYLLKAARAGVSYVMPALSDLYYCGEGCEENMKLAAYWAYQSIKHEENDGYYMLGIFFKDGYFFPQCLAKSKYCFERAKEIREDVDEFLDDEMYEGLEPVEPMIAPFNDSDASFFTQECPFRQYQQALALLHGVDEDGNVVSVDPAAGLKLLELSAEQGYAAAQFCLGAKYLNSNEGDGIRYDEDGAVLALGCDNRKATHYLDLAAEQGHPDALRIMIPLYAVGDIDVQKNTEKSNEYKALKNKLFQNDEDDEDEDEDEDDEDEDEEDKDEWESFDDIDDLLQKLKTPSLFADPRDRCIVNSCEYMAPFLKEAQEEFEGGDNGAVNEIIGSIFHIEAMDLCEASFDWDKVVSHTSFESFLRSALYGLSGFEPEDPYDFLIPLANIVYYIWKYNPDNSWFGILCHVWAELGGECDENLLWFKRMRDCGDCNGTANDSTHENNFGEILDRHNYNMGSDCRLYEENPTAEGNSLYRYEPPEVDDEYKLDRVLAAAFNVGEYVEFNTMTADVFYNWIEGCKSFTFTEKSGRISSGRVTRGGNFSKRLRALKPLQDYIFNAKRAVQRLRESVPADDYNEYEKSLDDYIYLANDALENGLVDGAYDWYLQAYNHGYDTRRLGEMCGKAVKSTLQKKEYWSFYDSLIEIYKIAVFCYPEKYSDYFETLIADHDYPLGFITELLLNREYY